MVTLRGKRANLRVHGCFVFSHRPCAIAHSARWRRGVSVASYCQRSRTCLLSSSAQCTCIHLCVGTLAVLPLWSTFHPSHTSFGANRTAHCFHCRSYTKEPQLQIERERSFHVHTFIAQAKTTRWHSFSRVVQYLHPRTHIKTARCDVFLVMFLPRISGSYSLVRCLNLQHASPKYRIQSMRVKQAVIQQ